MWVFIHIFINKVKLMSLLLLGLYFYLHITTSKMTQLKILSTKIKTK